MAGHGGDVTRPPLQHRHQIYVLGPNQDSRLTTVAASGSAGATIEKVQLQLDADAPFVLTGRAVRHKYTSALTQANLQGLKSKWTGPVGDYKQQDYILEALQMAYYGQQGNPKPIVPGVVYPASSTIQVDVQNSGSSSISNLTYFWWGYKLFPWDAVTGYSYPPKFSSQTFSYPVPITSLGVSETRLNQVFTVKQDADFVIRAGQGPNLFSLAGPRVFAEVAIQLMDHDKKPYSNDFVPFDIYFGSGASPATIPLGPAPSFVSPFGTGPGQPGILYPEIYVPKNHQLLYSLQRADGVAGTNQAESFQFNLIGSKVFER